MITSTIEFDKDKRPFKITMKTRFSLGEMSLAFLEAGAKFTTCYQDDRFVYMTSDYYIFGDEAVEPVEKLINKFYKKESEMVNELLAEYERFCTYQSAMKKQL